MSEEIHNFAMVLRKAFQRRKTMNEGRKTKDEGRKTKDEERKLKPETALAP